MIASMAVIVAVIVNDDARVPERALGTQLLGTASSAVQILFRIQWCCLLWGGLPGETCDVFDRGADLRSKCGLYCRARAHFCCCGDRRRRYGRGQGRCVAALAGMRRMKTWWTVLPIVRVCRASLAHGRVPSFGRIRPGERFTVAALELAADAKTAPLWRRSVKTVGSVTTTAASSVGAAVVVVGWRRLHCGGRNQVRATTWRHS